MKTHIRDNSASGFSMPVALMLELVVMLPSQVVGQQEQVATFPQTGKTVRGTFHSAKGGMDAERFYMTATSLLDGRVLVLGGYDRGISVSSKAWIYQP